MKAGRGYEISVEPAGFAAGYAAHDESRDDFRRNVTNVSPADGPVILPAGAGIMVGKRSIWAEDGDRIL
jgi:hypothetical protein